MTETVLLDIDHGVATITLNRPESLNALNAEMAVGLSKVIITISRYQGLRAVVLQGAGDHFMAGGDIRYFNEALQLPPQERHESVGQVIDQVHDLVLGLHRLPVPVIAVIRGSVAGFGMSLVAASDLAIASEEAEFCQAYLQIGTTPDGGNTYFMPRLVGLKKAMEWTLLSGRFNAEEALAQGLINRVVSAQALESTLQQLLQRLCAGSADAIGRAKGLLRESFNNSLEAQLVAERRSFTEATLTSDFAEGVQAFLEKRTPDFHKIETD